MKMPSYIKVTPNKDQPNKNSLTLNVTIKRWGIPIIAFKIMRESLDFPWYGWMLYPYFSIKLMLGWGKEKA